MSVAGDWIKMQRNLLTCPKVVRIMSALNADRFRTIGGIFSAWCLFDEHTEDGILSGYSAKVFDDFIGFPGLCQAMVEVGWIQVTPQALIAVNFTEHNGKTARRRAQENVRKRSARNAPHKRTREEKRREDIDSANAESLGETAVSQNEPSKAEDIPIPENLATESFLNTWAEWLKYRRGRNLSCKAAWAQKQLAMLATHGPEIATKALEQSMTQGYQGVFPERVGKKQNQPFQGIKDFLGNEK